MKNTTINHEGKIVIQSRTYGYSSLSGEIIQMDQNETSTTISDGGIYSSIEEL